MQFWKGSPYSSFKISTLTPLDFSLSGPPPPPSPKVLGGVPAAVSYGASLALCLSSKDPLGSGGLREEGEREAGNSVGVPTWLSPSLGSALVKPRAEHG